MVQLLAVPSDPAGTRYGDRVEQGDQLLGVGGLAVAENLVRAGQSLLAQILFCAPPHRSARPTTASRGWLAVLLRLAYLGVTNAFALLRLLPMSDHDKDVEILALRHQITVLQLQLGPDKPRFEQADRAPKASAFAEK
jgi:hypothetical protein